MSINIFLQIVLQCLAAADCDFINYAIYDETTNDQRYTDAGTLGLYKFAGAHVAGEECTSYPASDLNSTERFAQASVVISIVLAMLAFLAGLFECIVKEICCNKCIRSIPFALAVIFGTLTYTLFLTDYCRDGYAIFCTGGNGTTFNGLAIACYLGAGIIMCITPTPDACLFPGKDEDDENDPKPETTAPSTELT